MHPGDVSLPPKILIQIRERRQTVVRIHNDVDVRVEGAQKYDAVGWFVLQREPGAPDHQGVVVHMEERDLVILLAEDEEDRVDQLSDFGE